MKTSISFLLAVVIINAINAQKDEEKSIFPFLPVAVPQSNNLECRAESELYQANLDNFTLWAFEMWDATAKSSSGVLRGNNFQLGHFEQCISAEAPFLTKFCLVRFEADVPKPKRDRDFLSLYHHPNENVLERLYPYKDVSQQMRNILFAGWCIPASCTTKDLETYLNFYINDTTWTLSPENVTYSAKVPEIMCSTKEEKTSFNIDDYCFCSLATFLIMVVIASTIFDFYKTDKIKTFSHKLLMGFSARKNFNDLTRKDQSDNKLGYLYGVRTICMYYVIMDHRFGIYTSQPMMNFNYVEEQYRAPLAPLLFHGDLSVNIFFIMAGTLVALSLLKQLDKKKINAVFVIFMRYIRLTPAYAFVVFYYATIYNYTGSGPFWKVVAGQESQDCKDNWWTNLLYISNYVNSDHMCMAHSWYLPCDFHYFILGIALCFLIKKNHKIGLFVLTILTTISIIIPFAITVIYQRPALLHFYPEFLTAPKIHPDFQLTYIKSHARATSYFVGIFLGYLYYRLDGKNFHLKAVKSHILLVVSIVLIIISIFSGAVFYDPYHAYNAIEAGLYAALYRPTFDIGIAGLMLVCSFGHAPFLRKILSWSPFIPMGKLVYCVYLVHMQFQLRYASIFMTSKYFSYFDINNLALADTVLAYIFGLALYLLVEAPFKNVFREILMRNTEHVESSKENEDHAPVNGRNGTCDSRL